MQSSHSKWIRLSLFLLLVSPLPAISDVCRVDGLEIEKGKTVNLFRARTVPPGESCESVSLERQCLSGGLSGDLDASYSTCTALEGFTGLNVNRRPGQLNSELVARTKARWIRANFEVLAYYQQNQTDTVDPNWPISEWDQFIAIAEGPERQGIVNLMWDFERRDRRPPRPGSKREAALFSYLDDEVLPLLTPHAEILTVGNEPFVNTSEQDWQFDPEYGGIPLVVFYSRLSAHLDHWLRLKGHRETTDLYMGAFTRLHTESMQAEPAVSELLAFAEATPWIDGIDLHTHVTNLRQIDRALSFARQKSQKPIIVTEYTMVWAMRKAVVNGAPLGPEFSAKWGYNSDKTIHEYLTCDVFHRGRGCRNKGLVSKEEWDDFFRTRPWFINDFLIEANAIFRKHNVHGATFGFTQSEPTNAQLKPDRVPWYMGFLFSGASLGTGPQGLPLPNYQYLDNFLELQTMAATIGRP